MPKKKRKMVVISARIFQDQEDAIRDEALAESLPWNVQLRRVIDRGLARLKKGVLQ